MAGLKRVVYHFFANQMKPTVIFTEAPTR